MLLLVKKLAGFLIIVRKKNMEIPEIKKDEMKTLVACINSLVIAGFTEDFKIAGGKMRALKRERNYLPEEVKILNFYRFEGDSDPADNSILYAIETSDGSRGTIVDAYGPYADSKISSFIDRVGDVNKKTNREEKL
jgi:hypothetical protein